MSAARPSSAWGPVAIIWRWRRCRGSPRETRCTDPNDRRAGGGRGARHEAAERPLPDRIHRLERPDRACQRPESVFFTDGRYTEQSRHEVPDVERVTYLGAIRGRRSRPRAAASDRAAGVRGARRDGRGSRRAASPAGRRRAGPDRQGRRGAALGEGRRGARRCCREAQACTDRAFEDILDILAVG